VFDSLFKNKGIRRDNYDKYRENFDVILNNSYTDERFNALEFSSYLNITIKDLNKLSKYFYGIEFKELVLEKRLEASKELLKYKSIDAAAYEVGFSDPSYFVRCYESKFKKPPYSSL
jgi:AraC-like DNA-binding protein